MEISVIRWESLLTSCQYFTNPSLMNCLLPLCIICSLCRKHSQFFLRLPLYMLRIIYLQVVILLILCTVIALHIYIVVILYMCNSLVIVVVRHLLVLLLLISIIIDIVIYRLWHLLLWRNTRPIRRHLLDKIVNMSWVICLLL